MNAGPPPLAEIVVLLDEIGAAYMLVGSYASTFYGEPRTTRDVDIVVEMDGSSLEHFLQRIDRTRFYVPDDTARVAVRDRDQFNIIDVETGWKVDLIVRHDRAFSREELDRRRAVTMDGLDVYIASPEDTILSKLEWSDSSRSERQLADVEAMLRVSGATLDRDYLDRWAAELGVASRLEQVWNQARGDG